jgi:hypothetical protein
MKRYSRKKDVVRGNIEQYGNNNLLLLFEGETNGFIEGRFLKLRVDSPRIFRQQTEKDDAEEKDIDLESGDFIEEISHFVLNIKDKRILSEYNQSAVRHLVTPLSFYLRKTLDLSEEQVEIEAIQIDNVLKRIKESDSLFSVSAKIAKPKLHHMEKVLNLNSVQVLKMYQRSDFDLEISVRHKPRKHLDKAEAIENIEELFDDKDELEALKVETNDAAYDLINGALMHFNDNVVLDEKARFVLSWDFYQKARKIYNSNRNAILGNGQNKDKP